MAELSALGLLFRVRYADGRTEQVIVDSDRALIGSGAHCEIRLPTTIASVEHVAVSLVGGSVHAQARALDRIPTVNGAGFMQTVLLPDSVVGIGDVQISIAITTIDEGAHVIKKKENKTSPLTYVLVLIAIPLAGYILFADNATDSTGKPPKDVPSLWGAPILACPQDSPDQALALGIEKKIVAEGKRERRPFHVQDGVAAVPLFETAAACFRVAGDTEAAREAADNAQILRRQVAEDYRAHQVRLEHALSVTDLKTAQKEVRVLRAFTDGQSGAYVIWLSNLDRKLQLKLGSRRRS